jgi:hypothetical protein
MSVSCESCVLSGRGLCAGLITRPEETYRVRCVCVSECDREASIMRKPWPAKGRSAIGKNKICSIHIGSPLHGAGIPQCV